MYYHGTRFQYNLTQIGQAITNKPAKSNHTNCFLIFPTNFDEASYEEAQIDYHTSSFRLRQKWKNEEAICKVWLCRLLYISPNQRVNEIIKFLHFVLLPYTPVGSADLGEEYDTMPMIIGGDFNINFSSDKAEPLILFLREKLNLRMNTNRNIPTTNSDTTIDAVFSRYLETLQSQLYVSYFSYHKPIILFIKEIEQ